MANLLFADRVKDTTTTVGTGNITLSNSAPTGFVTFNSAFGTGTSFNYQIEGSGGEWEVGIGTLTSASTLVRSSVLYSSNSNAAVNFSAGTKVVFHSLAASSIFFNTDSSVTNLGLLIYDGTTGTRSKAGSVYQPTSASLSPITNDAVALGTTTLMWSDLFLASGAVINFNNGNVTLTHSAGVLTLAGTLALGSNNLTMTGSLGSTGARLTKVWATDLEVTNTIVGNVNTATTLATGRSIYGNSFNGSADLTQIIASTYGGTGNGFTKFSGPATTEKTFTLPNASATILTDNAVVTSAQGGTGVNNGGRTITIGTSNASFVFSSAVTLTVAATASISGTNTGDQTTISGNAGSATVLQTARNINGVSFNGSADITVTAAAGTLTGTTLNSTVVSSSLTAVGTISTGTWQGTLIGSTYGGTGNAFFAVSGPATTIKTFTFPNASATVLTTNAAVTETQGGTNQTSYTTGDILYASTTNTLAKLAAASTGNALISGTTPSWGKIGLTTHVSGTLPVANGGTNSSSASITAFNNITGYSASGATGTTSTNIVFSTSPVLTTPNIGTPSAGTLTNCTGYKESFIIAVSDEGTALTTGTAKVTFRMPYAFTVTEVRINVNTAPTGAAIIVDVKESGTTIFSTKPQIAASAKTNVGGTLGTISDSSLADDAEMTINIDQVGSTVAGKGLKVTFIGYR